MKFEPGDYVRVTDTEPGAETYVGMVACVIKHLGTYRGEELYTLKLDMPRLMAFSDRYLELAFHLDPDGYPLPPTLTPQVSS